MWERWLWPTLGRAFSEADGRVTRMRESPNPSQRLTVVKVNNTSKHVYKGQKKSQELVLGLSYEEKKMPAGGTAWTPEVIPKK